MRRSLEPELLDSLPPDHPDALHNRRDLRLTNLAMRNYAWFERTLPRLVTAEDRVLEVGAGTGELARLLHARGVRVDGLDLWPRPADWPANATWHQANLLQFDAWGQYSVVLGNLIFHQFAETELAAIGRRLAHAKLVLASEPVRRRASQLLFGTFAPLFGANHVSLHDARVSIAAGFLDQELPHALQLHPQRWTATCRTTWLGAYRMLARRTT